MADKLINQVWRAGGSSSEVYRASSSQALWWYSCWPRLNEGGDRWAGRDRVQATVLQRSGPAARPDRSPSFSVSREVGLPTPEQRYPLNEISPTTAGLWA